MAETVSYYDTLKAKYKAKILVPEPAATLAPTAGGSGAAAAPAAAAASR